MNIKDDKLKEILIKGNYIEEADLKKVEEDARKQKISLGDALLVNDLISEDLLGQAIAEYFDIKYADLNSNKPSQEQVLKIPEEEAKKHRIVLFSEDEEKMVIATDRPDGEGLEEALRNLFPNKRMVIFYSLSQDIDDIFSYYREELDTRFSKIIEEEGRVAPEILAEIFADAFSYKASDIHFEPQREEVVIRFRIDGRLKEAGRISKEYYEKILNRIKVMSGLRIDKHSTAQDGSIHYEKDDLSFDLRTSVVPTVQGEKVALRILASYMKGLSLADLGLSEEDQETFKKAAHNPFGMILVTGPTGSGKTTTLYSLLKLINNPDINVTTIEDPVEYKIQGVNQIQVNKETDLTFARGLRSIVRQDPDIILVGEIRDEETVEIAINAALTGHLLFSTFHANDSATAVPRLIDMGAEHFLLASTLELVVAQRLVRKICEDCRYSIEVSNEELKEQYPEVAGFFAGEKTNLYEGKGCVSCGDTGYRGRTGVFELIKVSEEMKELILENPSSSEIWDLARSQGSRTMFEDGIEKVRNGVTTLEELRRVAEPPENIIENKKTKKTKTKSKPKPKTKTETKAKPKKNKTKSLSQSRNKKGNNKNSESLKKTDEEKEESLDKIDNKKEEEVEIKVKSDKDVNSQDEVKESEEKTEEVDSNVEPSSEDESSSDKIKNEKRRATKTKNKEGKTDEKEEE